MDQSTTSTKRNDGWKYWFSLYWNRDQTNEWSHRHRWVHPFPEDLGGLTDQEILNEITDFESTQQQSS